MTYDEIMKMSDLTEKYDELEKYYIEEIDVLDWLKDTEETQKILFSDRFEVKKNGEYHNLRGPAIKYKNGNDAYWIDGAYYQDKSEWEKISTKLKRQKIMTDLVK